MTLTSAATPDELRRRPNAPGFYSDSTGPGTSAVSWGAILAGAAAAAALSLILLMLGTGLGLSSVSPWAYDGVSAKTLGVSTILWLTLTQLLASGMGGYLAGRLRTKWAEVHPDEVHFRDTAHGFLAWAVASLATAALLSSAISSIVNGGVQAGASALNGVAKIGIAATTGAAGSGMVKSSDEANPMNYFVESLFRKDMGTPMSATPANSNGDMSRGDASQAVTTAEVGRIFMNTVRTGNLPAEDLHYIGQLVAQRSGLTQQDAEKHVSDTYMRLQTKLHDAEIAARDAADKARKASAYAALWLFISLLIGAFVASLAATYGGRHCDA